MSTSQNFRKTNIIWENSMNNGPDAAWPIVPSGELFELEHYAPMHNREGGEGGKGPISDRYMIISACAKSAIGSMGEIFINRAHRCIHGLAQKCKYGRGMNAKHTRGNLTSNKPSRICIPFCTPRRRRGRANDPNRSERMSTWDMWMDEVCDFHEHFQ